MHYAFVFDFPLYRFSVVVNNVNWGVYGIEGNTDLNDLRDTVKKKLGTFAPDIPSVDQFNASSIPALDEGERILKEKCLKNSQLNNSYELTMVSHFILHTYRYPKIPIL